MLSGICQLVGSRHHERIVWYVYDTFERRHFGGIYHGSHHIAHEEEFCFAVVHDVVYLVCRELMQHRYSHGAVSQGRQEYYCPRSAVSTTDGDFVSVLNSAVFK